VSFPPKKNSQYHNHKQIFNIYLRHQIVSHLFSLEFEFNWTKSIWIELTWLEFKFKIWIQLTLFWIELNWVSIEFKLHAMSFNIFIEWNLISTKSIHYFHELIIVGSVEQCKAQVWWKGWRCVDTSNVSC
jgi:hypothetical protein